jgi:hypothetical protein
MGQFYKLFRCSNAKSLFLVVNASLRWLNNVSGVYFVQVSLLLIGQQGLGHFFRYHPLLSIGWRIVQILRQHQRKTANTAPTVQYKQQANPLLSINNYTPLVISGNDKNKQLTLLSQWKLTLIPRYTLFAI